MDSLWVLSYQAQNTFSFVGISCTGFAKRATAVDIYTTSAAASQTWSASSFKRDAVLLGTVAGKRHNDEM